MVTKAQSKENRDQGSILVLFQEKIFLLSTKYFEELWNIAWNKDQN